MTHEERRDLDAEAADVQTQLDEIESLRCWHVMPVELHGEQALRAERQGTTLRHVVHRRGEVLIDLVIAEENRLRSLEAQPTIPAQSGLSN